MRRRALFLIVLVLISQFRPSGQTTQDARNEALFEAARAGDTAKIAAALDAGANINARARYDVTALIFAAINGHLDAVKLLVARGADVNVQDTFYRGRAADSAFTGGHIAVAIFLLQNGTTGADTLLAAGVQTNNVDLVRAAAGAATSRSALQSALTAAERLKREPLISILKSAFDKLPAEPPPSFVVSPAQLPRYVGTYRDAAGGFTLTVTAQGDRLTAQGPGAPPLQLQPTAEHVFRAPEANNATLTFNQGQAGQVGQVGVMESITLVQGPATLTLARVPASAPGTGAATAAAPAANAAPSGAGAATVVAPAPSDRSRPSGPRNWPAFRGDAADGNGDGQRAVTEWDVASGKNIKWKTPIPGIANSSPIVWGNRVFVTSAISKAGDKSFRTGLYGDVLPVNDLSEHEWKVYALDKASGKILWERTAFTGVPKTKRHTKATQANSTPVTNGTHLVAAFGPIGLLVAWDLNGKERWRADLGTLDSGWFFDPGVQWGHSSSPIIYRNSVIMQADMQKGSYLAAWDLNSGKQLWKTIRPDEISTWGTPTVVPGANGRDELVTNGTKVRGYDPTTGKLLWTLGPNSEITIGTPVVGHGLVFVTGGYPPVRPVYAIRPGASGDISLPKGADSSASIAWSNMTEGTYIPTPVIYGGYLYTLAINGIVTAYHPLTGQRAFRGRVGLGGAFSASPVAADGRLYVASEDGEVYVVAAGPGLTQIAKNDMKEVIMATPAISDGLIILRTLGHVYGIGQ
jgi:outer membrane protein assembly factor BamB